MNALKTNPCSLNLVPPAKKHKPRIYAYRSSWLSLCYGTGETEQLTNTTDEEVRLQVSYDVPREIGWVNGESVDL